ncbi:hypothetical protein ACFFMN_32465 [Planobispora siamensis]|uniref:SWIM-type domain-containing protein n=1 Tax=Planobispora siamensis TaxID=936338 RepID=A0A8J3WIW7_9ACTN|nr:hypothetical protein [Planobispora siamensis]GIH91008.1 hypothetical protein Psi01_16380 [Planobispora siamensis]
MTRVAELIEAELARTAEAVLAEGGELERAGAVQLVRFGPAFIAAEVGGGRERVELQVVDGALKWYCTCDAGRQGAFCTHCVATAQSVRRRTDKNASCGVPSETASDSTVRIAS